MQKYIAKRLFFNKISRNQHKPTIIRRVSLIEQETKLRSSGGVKKTKDTYSAPTGGSYIDEKKQAMNDFKKKFPNIITLDKNDEFVYQKVKMKDENGMMNKTHKYIIMNYLRKKDCFPQIITIDLQNETIEKIKPRTRSRFSYESAKDQFKETFLPVGYPESVGQGYERFTFYTQVNNFCITLMNFISTQALFVSLGSSHAGLFSAALTWVLKDGIGQFGGIIFANRYGGNFDEDSKKWRFVSTAAINISIIIELLTLQFPHLFLFLASLANTGKNICYLTASASRARILQGFSKYNNVADVTGKAVSQGTASTLLGFVAGIIFTQVLQITALKHILPFFTVVSAINLLAAYYSVNELELDNFNPQRASIVLRRYLDKNQIIGPKEVSDIETFIFPNFLNKHYPDYIKIGQCSVEEAMGYTNTKEADNLQFMLSLFELFEGLRFICYLKRKERSRSIFKRKPKRKYNIHISMSAESGPPDTIFAYLFAIKLDQILQSKNLSSFKRNKDECNECIKETREWFRDVEKDELLTSLIKAGWNLAYIYLDDGKNRYKIYKMSEKEETEEGHQGTPNEEFKEGESAESINKDMKDGK